MAFSWASLPAISGRHPATKRDAALFMLNGYFDCIPAIYRASGKLAPLPVCIVQPVFVKQGSAPITLLIDKQLF
ncbi:hypothetical protein [Parachitinimonas caeni]|uniref:Uncharacterized protein n=1 Tax=Parachitinimonas caeni TaxID=3031301 RepID=A0ABT7E0Q7_9NEIS|nr:hypothetical protein [Parachitinimonas caeni]MDK2125900.1 hypothetical protein [Parachitinimonas caeni]